MSVSLSIKNVPDELAERLRARAARNRRSLQRELLVILEAAAAPGGVVPGVEREAPPRPLSIEEVFERAAQLLPRGTPSSVDLIREMRDERAAYMSDRHLRAAKRRTR